MRYAVISNGVVENVINADQNFVIDGKTLVQSDTANIGFSYANGVFTDPNSPTLQEQINAHKSNYRDQRILEGITLSGVSVKGDDRTQNNLIAARIMAKEDVNYTVKWKAVDGFVSLNATQIIAIADALRTHIQTCFDAEASLTGNYSSISALETAFDNAYNGA